MNDDKIVEKYETSDKKIKIRTSKKTNVSCTYNSVTKETTREETPHYTIRTEIPKSDNEKFTKIVMGDYPVENLKILCVRDRSGGMPSKNLKKNTTIESTTTTTTTNDKEEEEEIK